MRIQCIYSNTLASVVSISKFASRKQPVFLFWFGTSKKYSTYSIINIMSLFKECSVGQLLSWPSPSLHDEKIH